MIYLWIVLGIIAAIILFFVIRLLVFWKVFGDALNRDQIE